MGEFTRVSTCFEVHPMILQMDASLGWGAEAHQSSRLCLGDAWRQIPRQHPPICRGLDLSVVARALDVRPCKK